MATPLTAGPVEVMQVVLGPVKINVGAFVGAREPVTPVTVAV